MKTLLKNWFTLLVVIVIVGINIYNHYDRLESEKRIRETVKDFNEDLDVFVYESKRFEKQAQKLVNKLENGEKIYVKQ